MTISEYTLPDLCWQKAEACVLAAVQAAKYVCISHTIALGSPHIVWVSLRRELQSEFQAYCAAFSKSHTLAWSSGGANATQVVVRIHQSCENVDTPVAPG